MTTTQRKFLLGLGIALLLGGGIYWYLQSGNMTNDPGYTIEVIDDTEPPSLDRPYVITANLPEEAKTILRADVEEMTSQLREEPTRVDLWLQLGVHYKIAGDFEGASDAWIYVESTAPEEIRVTALGNLGDLYMNFIKDYPRAENYYRQALTLRPDIISYYRDLYTLYRYLYKTDTSAAADILAEGLEKNPGNPDLLYLQTELQNAE